MQQFANLMNPYFIHSSTQKTYQMFKLGKYITLRKTLDYFEFMAATCSKKYGDEHVYHVHYETSSWQRGVVLVSGEGSSRGCRERLAGTSVYQALTTNQTEGTGQCLKMTVKTCVT